MVCMTIHKKCLSTNKSGNYFVVSNEIVLKQPLKSVHVTFFHWAERKHTYFHYKFQFLDKSRICSSCENNSNAFICTGYYLDNINQAHWKLTTVILQPTLCLCLYFPPCFARKNGHIGTASDSLRGYKGVYITRTCFHDASWNSSISFLIYKNKTKFILGKNWNASSSDLWTKVKVIK